MPKGRLPTEKVEKTQSNFLVNQALQGAGLVQQRICSQSPKGLLPMPTTSDKLNAGLVRNIEGHAISELNRSVMLEREDMRLIDAVFVEDKSSVRRKKLLPWWIKVFAWIFLIFTAIVPAGLIFGLLGYQFQIGLYGINSTMPFSITGLALIALYAVKGVAAFGLLTERDWAITLGQADAILGMLACLLSMVALPILNNQFTLTFRLELLVLIPFLIKLNRIKDEWQTGYKAAEG